MSCQQGKKKAKEKSGNFICKNCGATNKNDDKLCQPKKIKKPKKGKKGKKGKKADKD